MGRKENVLLELIQGDRAQQWATQAQGWTTHEENHHHDDACTWQGILCDDDAQIREIDLPAVGLEGTLPGKLGSLTELRILNLWQNSLTGTIPAAIAALPRLQVLNLGHNLLEGDFPTFASPELEYLNLNKNVGLAGRLSTHLAKAHPNLSHMDLGNTFLTGTLPDNLHQLTLLKKLQLSNCKLGGTIPPELLNDMPLLEVLMLNDNWLVGTIPHIRSSDSDESSSTTTGYNRNPLQQLLLQHNWLSGTVPITLADLPNLEMLFLDGNRLTGTVPREICERNFNQQVFQNNQLRPVPPPNSCDAVMCPLDSASSTGMWPCTPCPEPQAPIPYLQSEPTYYHMPFLGHTGTCSILRNEKHILDEFYHHANGINWIDAERWNNPNIPVCLYEGVDCNMDGHVTSIVLRNRNIVGQIPLQLGQLEHLRHLDLSENQLEGPVPSDLRFAPLETLKLGGNALEGPLPPLLCEKGGVNGNGDGGRYSCDAILCAPGTYHADGFGSKCHACPLLQWDGGSKHAAAGQEIYGAMSCGLTLLEQEASEHGFWFILLILAGAILLVCGSGICIGGVAAARRRKKRLNMIAPDDKQPPRPPMYRDESMTDAFGSMKEEDLNMAVYDHHLAAAAAEDEENGSSGEGSQSSFGQATHFSVTSSSQVQAVPSAQATQQTITRRSRDSSPEKDPNMESDVWLDVPKIA